MIRERPRTAKSQVQGTIEYYYILLKMLMR